MTESNGGNGGRAWKILQAVLMAGAGLLVLDMRSTGKDLVSDVASIKTELAVMSTTVKAIVNRDAPSRSEMAAELTKLRLETKNDAVILTEKVKTIEARNWTREDHNKFVSELERRLSALENGKDKK